MRRYDRGNVLVWFVVPAAFWGFLLLMLVRP